MKNTAHIDLKGRKITNARFIQVNRSPQTDSHLTAKLYVDIAIEESSVVRNIKDEDFINNNFTKINSITSNTQAVNDNQNITKAYVDLFHQENEHSRRDIGLSFNDEEVNLVKNSHDKNHNDTKLTNIDSVVADREPTSDNELANKKNIDDESDKNTILRFNQTIGIQV